MGSSSQSANQMTPLAPNFVPGPHDVICARGKEAKNHEGNKRYKALIQQSLEKYSQASSKYEKSIIVTEIIEAVRKASPNGGFVKEEGGQWYEVGDHLAREKAGQSLRDSLHSKYKSSTKAKRRKREVVSAGIAGNVESLLQENEVVSNRLGKLNADMKQRGEAAPELFVTQIFSQANLDILEAFKKDASLLNKFSAAEEQQKATKTEEGESEEGQSTKKPAAKTKAAPAVRTKAGTDKKLAGKRKS